MKKTFLLAIEINTDPLPFQLVGIRPEFTDRNWHESRFGIGQEHIAEHGCIDATIRIPAGSCWKFTESHHQDDTVRTAVYESVCHRP
jgi:hypothetical protein